MKLLELLQEQSKLIADMQQCTEKMIEMTERLKNENTKTIKSK